MVGTDNEDDEDDDDEDQDQKEKKSVGLDRFGLFFVLEGEGEVFLDGMYNKKICVKRKVSVEKKQGVKSGCAQQTQRCEATTERGALHQRALNSPQASSSSSLKELFGLLEEMFWFFSIETKKKPRKKEKKR